MRRNSRTRRISAPKSVAIAAPAPIAAVDAGALLQQLVLALSAIAPAPAPAPAGDAPAAPAPATVAAIAAVQGRQRRIAKAVKAARPITVISDDTLRSYWSAVFDSPVKRPWAFLQAVRYDMRAERFRSPTTQEFRRAKGFPSFLRPVTSILPAAPVFARLVKLGLVQHADTEVVWLRNVVAGVELQLINVKGKLAIDARTLDNSALDTAPRRTRLAITNFLNAMLFTDKV